MDFWTLTAIGIGGGILGAIIVDLLLWPLRAWQRRRATADYAASREGTFTLNDWEPTGWIDEGLTQSPNPRVLGIDPLIAAEIERQRDLWAKASPEPLYVRDPMPSLDQIRRVLDDLHHRAEPIPGEIVLTRAQ